MVEGKGQRSFDESLVGLQLCAKARRSPSISPSPDGGGPVHCKYLLTNSCVQIIDITLVFSSSNRHVASQYLRNPFYTFKPVCLNGHVYLQSIIYQ